MLETVQTLQPTFQFPDSRIYRISDGEEKGRDGFGVAWMNRPTAQLGIRERFRFSSHTGECLDDSMTVSNSN